MRYLTLVDAAGPREGLFIVLLKTLFNQLLFNSNTGNRFAQSSWALLGSPPVFLAPAGTATALFFHLQLASL